MAQQKTLLVIGAHMDDCESGAAGTIFKAIDHGLRVVLVNTIGDFSNRRAMQETDLETERKRVIDLAAGMGAEKILLDYPYHHYPDTIEARKEMARIVADVRPDVALIHNWEDYWVDHRHTGLVSRDAVIHAAELVGEDFPNCRDVYAYGLGAHQTHSFTPDTYVDVTPYIDRIAWVRFELDRIMGPRTPEEKLYRQHTRTFHPVDPSLNREMKLTAHAEMQLAQLRVSGAKARALYAEPFFAIFKRTTELW